MSYMDESRMPVTRVLRCNDSMVVCERAHVAASWLQRLRGLLFYQPLSDTEGLWITPCRSIHTLGMRYALDVVFVDREKRVRALRSNVRPARLCNGPRMRLDTLELPVGRIAQMELRVGDRLSLARPAEPPGAPIDGRET